MVNSLVKMYVIGVVIRICQPYLCHRVQVWAYVFLITSAQEVMKSFVVSRTPQISN